MRGGAKVLISQGKLHLNQHIMKRFLISGLVLLALGGSTSSFAQGSNKYDDDIYYNSKSKKASSQQTEQQQTNTNQNEQTNDPDTYTSSGEKKNARQYSDDEDYADYDNDYYYSTRINR